MPSDTDPLSIITRPDQITHLLRDRARGYSGGLRKLLNTSAALIEGYHQTYPFHQCVAEWQHVYVRAGLEMAATVAAEMGHADVADAIRSKEVGAPQLNREKDRILLAEKSLQRARQVLRELQAEGVLDVRFDDDMKAVFFELPHPTIDSEATN